MLKSKNKQLLIISSFLTLVISVPSFSGAGRTAAQFLTMGGGPRAAAMSDAYTAMSGDITSIFWNPSGLAAMQGCQFFTSYTDYSVLFGEADEGLYYRLFAAGIPLKNWGSDFPDLGTISTALQINGQGYIDITTDSPEVISREYIADNLMGGCMGGCIGGCVGMPVVYAIDKTSTKTFIARVHITEMRLLSVKTGDILWQGDIEGDSQSRGASRVRHQTMDRALEKALEMLVKKLSSVEISTDTK